MTNPNGSQWHDDEADSEWVARWMTPPQEPTGPERQAETEQAAAPQFRFERPSAFDEPPAWGTETSSWGGERQQAHSLPDGGWDQSQAALLGTGAWGNDSWRNPPNITPEGSFGDNPESASFQYQPFEKKTAVKNRKEKKLNPVEGLRTRKPLNLRNVVLAVLGVSALTFVIFVGMHQGDKGGAASSGGAVLNLTHLTLALPQTKEAWVQKDPEKLTGVIKVLGLPVDTEMSSGSSDLYHMTLPAAQVPQGYKLDPAMLTFAKEDGTPAAVTPLAWTSPVEAIAGKVDGGAYTSYVILTHNPDGSLSGLMVTTLLKGAELEKLEAAVLAAKYLG